MSVVSDIWCQVSAISSARVSLVIAISSVSIFWANCVLAQSRIIPDNTLGAELSVITTNTPIQSKGINADLITGGAQRGRNLFHSFSDFNVNAGQSVYFANPSDVTNILTRVTGGKISNIFGTLGVDGGANLFLINPAGILFGKNATLDLKGSFVGTTANGVQFGNLGSFSATNPQAPPLLTIDPSGLLFNQLNQGATITNQSIAGTNGTGLQVLDGKSLLLVGGNVVLDGGKITATSGTVELGGLASPGTVGLAVDGNTINLNPPQNVTRGDVTFDHGATVDVTTTANGGSISVFGQNVSIIGGSQLLAGVQLGTGTESSQVGDININATGTVIINQQSKIKNTIPDDYPNKISSKGNAGNINIQAGGDISIINLASTPAIDAGNQTNGLGDGFPTSQQGRAGNITLIANGNISVTGQNVNRGDQAISTFGASPSGGDISLKANGSISLDKAFFVTSNFAGDAGNISLQGNKSVSLADNSSLVSISYGRGNSGNITVESLSGPVSFQNSLVSTTVGNPDEKFNPSLGNAGNITISGSSVSVTNGTEISSTSNSGLNSGKIEIIGTEQVEISGIAPVIPRPDSDNPNTYKYTTLATTSEQASRGTKAGDITITTKNLRVLDGANLRAETSSNAPGGNININANTFELTGGSQLFTTAFSTGDAGNINLKVKDHVFISGTNSEKYTLYNQTAEDVIQSESGTQTALQIQTDVIRYATEQAGIVDPNYNLVRSGIFANTFGTSTAKGGNVNITTGRLQVENQGSITVSGSNGQAGNLSITARSVELDNGKLTAETNNSGNGGDFNLTAQDYILLRNGSKISTNAGTANAGGNGGNITINTPFIVAIPNENSDITANAFSGSGGQINISAQLFGIQPRQQLLSPTNDITASSQLGVQGQINVAQPQVDLVSGLVAPPIQLSDVTSKFSQLCPNTVNPKKKPLGSFTITGKGSIPPNPLQLLPGRNPDIPLANAEDMEEIKNIQAAEQRRKEAQLYKNEKTKEIPSIVEAQGIVQTPDGQIYFVANANHATPSSQPTASPCPSQN